MPRKPMSGCGAELYGGRFNPKGMPALYASTAVVTALREANEVGDLQPTTLVARGRLRAGDATALVAWVSIRGPRGPDVARSDERPW
ncbi:RES domain-containing protein [Mesorhizobium sp. CA12]|nr:RES domain-containing protein [Mesorhizobium sp. CA12]